MSKLDNFKKFVSIHPEFINYVNKTNTSWQSLYELYDIYGEDNKIWDKYLKREITSSNGIKGIINTLKNINIDSLEENINSIQKAVSLVSELTTEESREEKITPKETKIDNIYGE